MGGYLLGIDVGTSGTKAVLFDGMGGCLTAHTADYPMAQPQNGWAEQDPAHWWRATAESVAALLAKTGLPPAEIAGVGLSGQMHGLVLLDAAGEVLRPAIIWCDQRTGAECDEMEQIIGRQRIIDITASPPMTGFTAAKIRWVQKHEPDVYGRCAHILLPKDYIRYQLTGEFATDVSDASGMQLMDVAGRRWSGEMLEGLGIDAALLPRMHESPDITGRVHAGAARATGLAAGTPVVGGAGDNPAAAVGTGVVAEGRAFTSLGSSAVVYAVTDTLRADREGRVHSLCASVPGKWTVMSCTQAAGLSLQWLRNTCCVPEVDEADRRGVDPYRVMDELAKEIPIGAGKLLYLPYLMGERSPHPDPDCRGVFFGLSAIHTRAHLIRAVMEGVAYSQAECVDVFRQMGVPICGMAVTGGGGRSRLWRQMLADLYGCPVATAAGEGAALGAAMLAGVGAGVYSSVEEAASVMEAGTPQLPNAKNAALYGGYFQLYKKLYRDNHENFKHLAKL